MKGRLQHTEIPLYAEETGSLAPPIRGRVTIEPAAGRSMIQLQFNTDSLKLYTLSPEEAYSIGSSLVEHSKECGYDPVMGETGETRKP